LFLLLVFRLELFPLLICFDENANRGWKRCCPIIHGVVFNTTRKGPDILVVQIVTVFVPIVTKYTI
jgi:hypothetical protein